MIQEINNNLIKASDLINNKKFDEAENVLKEYIQKVQPLIKKSKDEISLCFNNVAEFYLYTQLHKPVKNVAWVSYKIDVAYQWLAYIANENKEYKKALAYAEKGLSYNPMNTDLIFEECETYKFQKDWPKLYATTKKVYPLIITARDVAKYYRALGYYYIEQGIFEVAYALYMFSLEYEESNNAKSELNFIRQTINNHSFKMTLPDAINIFLKNNINIGAPKKNIDLLKQLLHEENLVQNNIDVKYDIEEDIFALTKDDTYLHSFWVNIDEGKKDITEDITLKIVNNHKLLEEFPNKKEPRRIEYVLEDKNNTYKGYTIIDSKDLVVEEEMAKNSPYIVKVYGVFLSQKVENSFIEFKIASKD